MMRNIRRLALRGLSYLFSDRLAHWWMRVFSRRFVEQLRGAATDAFVEVLLRAMDLAFAVCKGFRRNIEGFKARYVFKTADGKVAVTADFADQDMQVHREAKDEPTVCVTFASAAALRDFLFAKDQDILNSLLANEVELEGNINYIYKFGFMARDLERRLGTA